MRCSSVFLALILGCSCPDSHSVGPDSAAPDATTDVSTQGDASDAGQDSASPEDVSTPPSPPECTGESVMNSSGALSGTAFGEAFSFSYIMAGIEPDLGDSCPRVFIRAGDFEDFSGPTFAGSYFELDVPYFGSDTVAPGIIAGNITWFFGDGEPMSEEVMVNITRADGLFENELPESERRIEFSISHHDATTDFDGDASVATYCFNFPMCL